MLKDAGFDEVVAEDRTDQVLHSSIVCSCALFIVLDQGSQN